MIYIQAGLYVVIEQLETELAPMPKPLNHGFSKATAYLVLGGFSLSESGDAYLILSNDWDEIWFISNRHLRTYQLRPGATNFRIPLAHNGARHTKHNGRHPAGAPEEEPFPANGTSR